MTGAAMAAEAGGWHRRVWRLAGPIILANVSTPLLGLVDTAVVGHLDHAFYLGAVAVGSLVFSFLFWGFGFLRMGTTGLTAQARGAGAVDEVRAILLRALGFALILGLLLILLRGPIGRTALWLIEASAEVETHADSYIAVRIWGAPATLANYVLIGWFLGLGRAGLTLILQLVLNGTNIVLDLLFVVGLGWGVPGVAAASAIAEYTALAVGLLLMMGGLRRLGGVWDWRRTWDASALRRLVAVNRDIFLRTLCLMAAFAWFTMQGARMGDVLLAANAVLQQFQLFMAYALDGFAYAGEVLIGTAVGAASRRDLRCAARAATIWAVGAAAGFSVVYLLFGPLIIDGLTSIEAVRTAARDYLPWAVVLPVVSVWGFILDGIFLGATRTSALRNAMAVSLAIFLAAVYGLVPVFGNHGLWGAFAIFMAARAVTLLIAYPALERATGR